MLTLRSLPLTAPLKMAPRGKNTPERKQRSALSDVVAREYTIHLHTRVHGHGFKHVRPLVPPWMALGGTGS